MFALVINKFSGALFVICVFFAPKFTFANWTPPSAVPFFCPINDPACSVPLNISINPQIKSGSLGVDSLRSTLDVFTPKMRIGPNFVDINLNNNQPPTQAVLDVDGQISIRDDCANPGRTAPCTNQVLISNPVGLASWADDLWKRVNASDIENTNSGTVYFKNALAKRSASLTGGNKNTHINLGSGSSLTGDANPVPNDRSGMVVGGGQDNMAQSTYSTISGGRLNLVGLASPSASGVYAVITGGSYGFVSGDYSVIMGGTGQNASLNTTINAFGNHSTIGGGYYQRVTAPYSTIVGGNTSSTTADYSFAGGRNVGLGPNADRSFIWGNSASALPPYNIPDSFVVFPNSSPYKVVIGTTDSTGADVSINGSVKIFDTATSSDLDVYGQVRIRGGDPAPGKVLSSDSSGLAVWRTPPTPSPSVLYLRSSASGQCSTGIPRTCAEVNASSTQGVTWLSAQENAQEYVTAGGGTNYINTCYQMLKSCRIMYLRSYIPSNSCDFVTYNPPQCLVGWDEADVRVEGTMGGNYNRVRTCVKCY